MFDEEFKLKAINNDLPQFSEFAADRGHIYLEGPQRIAHAGVRQVAGSLLCSRDSRLYRF
jgi:hypothetical protein